VVTLVDWFEGIREVSRVTSDEFRRIWVIEVAQMKLPDKRFDQRERENSQLNAHFCVLTLEKHPRLRESNDCSVQRTYLVGKKKANICSGNSLTANARSANICS
jgi:hypothetical protein